MPKMDFDFFDMSAPVVVALIFAAILFLISFTCINWYCISQKDDLTVFEKLGARANLRLGPHTMIQIKRGGFASTYAREEDEERRKLTVDEERRKLTILQEHRMEPLAEVESQQKETIAQI